MAENFCPRRELREKMLERALKTYIVPPFCIKYQVIALRALLEYGKLRRKCYMGQKYCHGKYIGRKSTRCSIFLLYNRHAI